MSQELFDLELDLQELKTLYRVLGGAKLKEIHEKQLLKRIEKLVTQNVSIEEFDELSREEK